MDGLERDNNKQHNENNKAEFGALEARAIRVSWIFHQINTEKILVFN